MEGNAREIDRAIRRDTPNTGASRSGSDPSPSESFHSIDEGLGDPQPSTSKPYTPAALTRPKVKAVVIQGPDGALYVGNQHVAAKLGRTAQSSAAEDGRASFDFGEHVSLYPSLHSCPDGNKSDMTIHTDSSASV